jgi:16S rRNA (cytosine1402-N4)-methyltransferase
MEGPHRPVMLEASVTALAVKPAGVYVDATFGRGGHSRLILKQLGPQGRLLAIDKDPEAVAYARAHFAGDARFSIVQGSFAQLTEIAEASGILRRVDGVLLDLGVSSPQLDQPERGFSFLQDGPLDMRMDPTSGQSAAKWLEGIEVKELARVLKEYGEERHAMRIAKAIVQAGQQAPIHTTRELAEIVARANPSWEKGKHPATRSFQAIRIHINRELEELRQALTQVLEVLAPGGRLAVISFHSLEDRMVKRFMREQSRGDPFPAGLPVTRDQLRPAMRLVGKPGSADARELAENPRARSAVLRVAERLA